MIEKPAPLAVSVLIATRSRAASLQRTLDSMRAMETTRIDWEIVVVDNGSDDATPELLERYAGLLPLRWFRVPEPGQNRARNRVLPLLRGALTVLTDDDVLVARDWLDQWVAASRRWPAVGVFGGRIAPRFPEGTAEWLMAPGFPFRAQCYAEFRPQQTQGPIDVSPFGPNFAVRTELLRRHRFRQDLGPASNSYAMGGETELVGRLRAQGHGVVYIPGAYVEHCLEPRNLTIERLLQRGFNAGRGDEYRRAMRRGWSRPQVWARAHLFLPLKIALYAALAGRVRKTPEQVREPRAFRRLYKHQSARGRREQLRRMLQGSAAAETPGAASAA